MPRIQLETTTDPAFKELDRAFHQLRRRYEKTVAQIDRLETEKRSIRDAMATIHIALNTRRRDLGLQEVHLGPQIGL